MGGVVKRWGAVAVGMTLALGSLVLAVNHDGFNETKVDLNDAGIWVTSRSLGAVGRVNTQIRSIEVRFNAPSEGADVLQTDDTVVIVDEAKKKFSALDVAHAEPLDSRQLPAGGTVLLGGPSGAVVDRETGRAWIAERAQLGSIDVKKTKPTATTGKDAVAALGLDGTLHVYSAVKHMLYDIQPSGTVQTYKVDGEFADPQITAVGTDAVVLDAKTGVLVVPAQGSSRRTVDGDGPVLQQPGPDRKSVLVGTDDALLGFPLDGGSPTTIDNSGSGDAVAPVSLEGCDYGAWSARPRYAFHCDGGRELADKVPGLTKSADLTFRVNRKRILLNDRQTGNNLLFTEDRPKEVNDWESALNKDERDDKNEDQTVKQKQEKDCAEAPQAPQAEDDEVGTRQGRPVIVPVLDNDDVDRCDVVAVAIPEPLDAKVGTATVVEDGTAIQVTPTADGQSDIALAYEVVGRDNQRSRAQVAVTISTGDEANEAPVAVADKTVVESGRSVTHNVLLNDTDPDGDALTLVKVSAPTGQVQYDASGKVQFTSAGGSSGTPRLRYTVQDERGEPDEGTLDVAIQPAKQNILPTVRPDRLVAFVDKEARIDLLANDTDPNGDRLQVSKVDAPASLQAKWDDNGTLRVTPKEAGSYQFGYEVLDAEGVAKGRIRIDVRAAKGNNPPVAVRDDVVVRSGTPALVDLVANDLDLDGDVLAVSRIETAPESALSVELLEMRIVRVTAAAGMSQPETVRYWATDGGSPVEGVLVVRPYLNAGQDQAPIPVDDRVAVRAGNVTTIRVLENDHDPEGDRLRLAEVEDMKKGQGLVFREGDELRYRASADATGSFTTFYVAEDPAGNRSTGQLDIQVLPKDSDNRPPAPPTIQARVSTGKSVAIAVKLTGIDPDGDTVGLLGIEGAPSKGRAAVASGSAITYTADLGAVGTDEFSYRVKDALGLPGTGRVRLVIAPAPTDNTRPVAVPDKVVLQPGEERAISVLKNDVDPDGDPLSLLATGKDAPTKPRLADEVTLEGDKLVYRAPDSIDGNSTADSFTYGVTDERGGTARGVVTVTIQKDEPKNEPPQARDDLVEPLLAGGKPITVKVLANDFDPDDPEGKLSVSLPDPVAGVTVSGSALRVDPGKRSKAFVYLVTDADGATARAVVRVPVFTSLPPIANADVMKVSAGDKTTANVLANDKDPGGKKLSLVDVVGVRGGTVKVLDKSGRVQFTAADKVSGDAGFSYRVSNGDERSTGAVRVEVKGQNFPPVFQTTAAELPAGGSRLVGLEKLVTDRNPGDKHTFSDVKSDNSKVKVALSKGQLEITAADDAKGARANVSLKVSDGSAEATGRLTVEVTGHEGPPPQAVDDEDKTTQGVSVSRDVTTNDVDPLGEGLEVKVLSQQGGTATASGRSISFKPESSFFGVALVTYEITDGSKEASRTSRATYRVTVVGFPGKPSAPSSTNAKAQSKMVSLQWGVPANNGGPISGYVVQTDGGKTQEFSGNKGDFTGLTNAQPYRFRVAARNEAVKSDSQLVWSDYSTAYTPDTVPGPPPTPTLVYGDGSIQVTWSKPVGEWSEPIKYVLTIQGGTNERRDVGNVTSYRWTGLANGSHYAFSVVAWNKTGEGQTSGTTNITESNGTPAGKPHAPQAVTATRNDSDTSAGGKVKVTWNWEETPTFNNGDAAKNFTVVVAGGPGAGRFAVPASARQYDASGLANGRNYSFSIYATNKAGDGETGSASAIPAKVPAAPTGLTASEGDTEAPLSYTAPDDGGAAISSYEITSNRGSVGFRQGGSGVTQTGSSAATGLTNGQSYTFQLRACNEVGCGPWSAASNAVTPYGDPSAPSVSVSVSNRTTLTWNWNTPSGNGRPIDHYEVSLDGSLLDGNYTGTSVSRTFGYSENHTLSVVAVNAANRKSPAGSRQGTTEASPKSVTLSKGSSAVGVVNPTGPCTSSSCAYLRVSHSGFGGGSHTIECWTNNGGTGKYYTYTTANNPSEVCYFGYPGSQVWVKVDGTESNHITW